MKKMEIIVNSKPVTIEDDFTIQQYLDSLGLSNKKAIAVAVNGEIVRKDEYSEFFITEGDSMEIVRAIGGG